MYEQNKKKDSKKTSLILRRLLHSSAVAALLLPNIAPIVSVAAEEATEEIAPTQVTGIHQDNLVFEDGTLSLVNQTPGENIAVALPNGSLVYKTVPYHGTWTPRLNLDRYKVYAGDTLEFFTYDGSTRSESTFLTLEGDGETRPADQQAVKYGRQSFSFIPTANSTYVGYSTEPFFSVEMTFPNGHVDTQTANVLGQTRFNFPEGFTAEPGETFSVRVFDRNGEMVDLTNLDLFRPLTVPNQGEVDVYGEVTPDPDPVPEATTVTIDPNGGEMNEDFRVTEVAAEESYTLPYGFQSNLARSGYTLQGYSVEGTLLDADGNEVTEIPTYSRDYTPVTDVTLTANWEVTAGKFTIHLYDETPATQPDRYSVKLVADDGTEYALTPEGYGGDRRIWEAEAVPNGTYTLVIDDYDIAEAEKFGQNDTTSSFTVNEDNTATVELEFVDDKSTSFIRYQVYGDPTPTANTVTIDPNGGEMNAEYTSTEVTAGETYTLPYGFQSDLARAGYTLQGYSVEGTLLDADGNEVTEIPTYSRDYTPVSNVTLTANWEVSNGTFIIQDTISDFRTANRSFALTDGENTYDLTSNSYTTNYREWRVENVPNGTYTLLVDGVPYFDEWTFEKVGHPDTVSEITTDDSNTTVDLTFEDDSASTFIRYQLAVNTYPVGIEVRDLDNRRTSDIGIELKDEDGTVFEGTFDQYNLWTTTNALLPGTYTITLTTPEGTVAEINDTVASQTAVATDEDNVFTLEVNAENQGNLTRVFGAFRLVEVEEPAPVTDADRYEPVFVDEIILDLNRGNGKLKNPKTLIENMNEMPGGIKVAYTNKNQLDLSGRTTETQTAEITVTYRDGSTDVAEVPLTVIPKEKPSRPGRPIVQKIVKQVVRVVRTVISVIGRLFGGWF